MPKLIVLIAAALALTLAACGDSDEESGPSQAEQTTPAEEAGAEQPDEMPEGDEGNQRKAEREKPERRGTTIAIADSQFGPVIFDGDDQAIYIFDKEQSSESECYGDCAVEWPPVLTKGEPEAKGGAKQGKLGTTERRDGTTQVTYDGQPLYYYFDEGRGEVRCHNVPGFGGLWLAIDSTGRPV